MAQRYGRDRGGWGRLAKVLGIGGSGAALGAGAVEAGGYSAIGLVGSGLVGWGGPVLWVAAGVGALTALGVYGAWRGLRD